MELKYKPDWEECKKRYLAWWEHEMPGRCAMSIKAPKDKVPEDNPPAVPEKVEDRWFDTSYLKLANEYRMKNTFYGGEALPIWNPGYPGWANLQAYFGAEIELRETTAWSKPIILDEDIADFDVSNLVISSENIYWKKSIEMHCLAVEEAKGKSLPGLLNLAGPGDILAHLRGTERLLFDVVENPECVYRLVDYITNIWMEVYEKLYNIIRDGAEGSTSWFELWSPERFYCLSCDFSYMISPKMFQEIFLPGIEKQAKLLKHVIYHVDGVGAFAHVDALCEIPEIQALQILPGEGKPSPLHYMDVLKKVQAAGKNLHITISPKEVETALGELSAKGLFIQTTCDTEEEARYLLKMAEKWSKE